MTLVSCVIPIFNGEEFLEATLNSIAEQSVTGVEVIVADDGSTDRSVACAQAYQRIPIKVLRQDNSGAASARNLGHQAQYGRIYCLPRCG